MEQSQTMDSTPNNQGPCSAGGDAKIVIVIVKQIAQLT